MEAAGARACPGVQSGQNSYESGDCRGLGMYTRTPDTLSELPLQLHSVA